MGHVYAARAVIPGMMAMASVSGVVDLDIARMLHGEQAITLHRPFPASGELKVKGHIVDVWDKGKAAVRDLDAAIDLQQPPSPDLYLERAKLLQKSGAEYHDIALKGLDEGIEQLGPIVSLAQLGIEIERDRGNLDAALRRIDRLPEKLRLLPAWLMLRGDILVTKGDDRAAAAAFRRALARIEALPPGRRSTRNMLALERQLREKLREIGADDGGVRASGT